MSNFQQYAATAQNLYNQYQSSHGGPGNSNNAGQPGAGGGNVNDVITKNLSAMLAPDASSQPQTQSRGLGSFVSGLSGLTSAANLDEGKVNEAHNRAYNQQGGGMSDQDAGAAAGKEVFDRIFSGGNNNGNELANDVTELYGTAAKEQTGQQPGQQSRGLGSSLGALLGGAGGQAQPPRQKDTFEKIVDLISREVAKVSFSLLDCSS